MILDLFKKKAAPLDKASAEILDQAMVQRARMDMEFDSGTTNLKGLSCALNSIGAHTLLLDVYGLKAPGHFTGATFTCHFRIREGRAGVGYFGFRTQVESVRQAKSGGIVFVVSVPSKVERSQRRRSMRVRPALSWFEELLIWRGEKLFMTGQEDILAGLKEFSQGQVCRLENMSAGGLGLHLKNEFCKQSEFRPVMGEPFTFYMRFAQELRNQPRELWLSGRAVRLLEDRVTRDVDLGLMFDSVGRRAPEGGEMLWMPIEENVAEELLTRVFEWHAELCRSRATITD